MTLASAFLHLRWTSFLFFPHMIFFFSIAVMRRDTFVSRCLSIQAIRTLSFPPGFSMCVSTRMAIHFFLTQTESFFNKVFFAVS